VDLEEGTGINPDEEPYAISSDDDSIGSEFQGIMIRH
jgi:DNA repair protein RAD16